MRDRALWIVAVVAMLVPTLMLLAVSDNQGDRFPGLVLLVMTVTAVALASWLLASPDSRARTVSLLTSILWLAGAALVYPTQEFAADAAWPSGVPLLAAVITAGLACVLLPPQRSTQDPR
ncbi:MAG TPA: hypothetical protein VFD59_07410 [Nocardioidaceae bacterium]|nr:hypothetical protein [Nocardioidaceae bacterium]